MSEVTPRLIHERKYPEFISIPFESVISVYVCYSGSKPSVNRILTNLPYTFQRVIANPSLWMELFYIAVKYVFHTQTF